MFNSTEWLCTWLAEPAWLVRFLSFLATATPGSEITTTTKAPDQAMCEDPNLPSKYQIYYLNLRLLQAAKDGDLTSLTRLLLCPGIDVNTDKRTIDPTTLWWAVAKNNREMVKILLKVLPNEGHETSWPNHWRQNPLMVACYYGYTEIVELLLAHPKFKSRINQVDNKGNTALHIAAISRSDRAPDVIHALLREPNTNVNALNGYGRSPLYEAILFPEKVSILLRCHRTNVTIDKLRRHRAWQFVATTNDFEKMMLISPTLLKTILDTINLIKSRLAGNTLPGGPTCRHYDCVEDDYCDGDYYYDYEYDHNEACCRKKSDLSDCILQLPHGSLIYSCRDGIPDNRW